MSRPLLKRLRGGLSDALLTALAGFGLSLLLLTALLGQANMGLLAAACAVPALLICLSKAVSPRACVGLLVAAFALLALGCLNIGPLAAAAQPLRVFMLYPDLLGSALPPYRIVLNILLPVLLTSLCAIAVLIDVPTLTLLPMALLSIVFGTELIGPLLVKNPHMMDMYLRDLCGDKYKKIEHGSAEKAYEVTLKALLER